MATYKPRPDASGLVDVTTDTGQVLPMSEQQAQAGGAKPEGSAPPLAMGLPPPPIGPNPYSMIGSGQATAFNAPRVQLSPMNPDQPLGMGGVPFGGTPQPDKFAGVRVQLGPMGGSPDQPSPSLQQMAEKQSAAKALADIENKPPAERQATYAAQDRAQGVVTQLPEQGAAPGLTRIAPSSAQQQGPPLPDFLTGSPGRVIQTSKGGPTKVSWTVRPGEALAPGVKEYVDSINPDEIASRRETATKEAAQYRSDAATHQIDAIKQAEAELELQRARVAQNRAELQKRLDTIDQREREAAQATPQSRDEILGSRSTMAKMMSALSIALGARYQGLTGRNNPGLDMLNQSVNEEIAGQRAKYEAAKDRTAAARTAYGQAMQLYGDPNLAEADMRMRALTLAANMADAYKTQGANAEWLANQQDLTRQIRAQAATEKQNWTTLANGQVTQENWINRPATYARVNGGGSLANLTKEQREELKHRASTLIRKPDGSYGFVANENRQKDIQDQLTSGADVVSGMGKLLAIANDNTLTDAAKRARYKALAQDIRPIISVAKKQGAMGEQEVEGYEAILGSPDAIIQDNGAAIRTGMEQQIERNNRVIRDNVYDDPYALSNSNAAPAASFTPGLK